MNKELTQKIDKDEVLVNTNCPHLCQLINMLSSQRYPKIKNQKLLIHSLTKLYQVVGLYNVKESIAKQTTYLINKLNANEQNLKMLNTVLMGNPGCGKTSIGVIMAEIWYHLGYLDLAVKQKDQHQSYISKLSNYDTELLQFYVILFILLSSQLYTNILQPMYVKYGIYFILLFITLIFITIYTYLLYENDVTTVTTDNNFISILSRSDFIGQYMGFSEKKTEDLLLKNRGKVIFIDEAYSLYAGPNDIYGQESLNIINKFMSERPDEIVIIFAGYEEKLKQSIFTAQPGLSRRCTWQIKFDEYSGEELFEIFEQQVKKDHFILSKSDYYKIKNLIIDNKNLFVNAGGDCERLCFYCQLNNLKNNEITYKNIKYGLEELKANTMKIEHKTNWMEELSKRL